MLKKLCIILFAAALLSSCATVVPDIEAVSPVNGVPGVAALAQHTNSDNHRRLDINELLDFLYAQDERPDPKHPGKRLPKKGPAVCVSSVDWQRNETAIAQLCVKGKCTYEQKKVLARMQAFRRKAMRYSAFDLSDLP